MWAASIIASVGFASGRNADSANRLYLADFGLKVAAVSFSDGLSNLVDHVHGLSATRFKRKSHASSGHGEDFPGHRERPR